MPRKKEFSGMLYVHLTKQQISKLAKIAKRTGHTRATLIREGVEYIIMRYETKSVIGKAIAVDDDEPVKISL